MVAVEVVDRGGCTRQRRDLLVRAAAAAWRHGVGQQPAGDAAGVRVLVCGDGEISALHARFLGDSSTTDVISFPSEDGVDVVVNADCAAREAAARGADPDAELALYVVHGVLHARGFDDIDDGDRVRMRAAERAVLASLGVHIADVE